MPVLPSTLLQLLLLLAVLGGGAPATAQDARDGGEDAAQLVDALTDATRRPAARERLLALGAGAVPAIVARLKKADAELAPYLLSLLVELGPPAGAALPQVIELLEPDTVPLHVVVDTIAELAPWRSADATVTARSVQQASMSRWVQVMRLAGSTEYVAAYERVRQRFGFPRDADVATVVIGLDGSSGARVEFACDLLRARGPAAAAAVPALCGVLDRPEPRVLGTSRTLPVHAKAARAILAITATGDAADVARDVLAGRRAPPAAAKRAVPERLEQRIAALLAELRVASKRATAVANLVALGSVVAGPVGAELAAAKPDAETADALLGVLDALGPSAADAAPALYAALTTLSVDQATTALTVLTAVVPSVADVVPLPAYSLRGSGGVTLGGVALSGSPDPDAMNRFYAVITRFSARLRVLPGAGGAELAELLRDDSVEVREFALDAIAARGPACRSLLPAIGAMLTREQPRMTQLQWGLARGVATKEVDRTDHVQRLAARAMLAVAEPGDPLLQQAHEVLARPETK
jgi:hypothetical protein